MTVRLPDSVRVLLESAVDYAGLFPPARLDMPAAVANYAAYRGGPDAWALGRFVVPAAELPAFAAAAADHHPRAGDAAPWRLSAVAGGDLARDTAAVADYNREHLDAGAAVDAIEFRAASSDDVRRAARLLPGGVVGYAELP